MFDGELSVVLLHAPTERYAVHHLEERLHDDWLETVVPEHCQLGG